ncbi:MAG TPA: threonylcarbamoyl-AMP synthase [Candidatus Moranbacteria bacterium]|nr:threonylcarbamoyl-AMP synthase [Candidatus Moranbacteria bacterium]
MKNLKNGQKIIEILKKGGVGVLPTDTLYGLVGSALSEKAVGRIFEIKKRDTKKPLIVLISSLEELKLFGIKIDRNMENILEKIWPGKVSVIFPIKNKKWNYLSRGTDSLAVRFPKKKKLIELLKKTGPLAAPSANPQGQEPARNIAQAKAYFKQRIDFYVSGGSLKSAPSAIIAFQKGRVIIKREGDQRSLYKLRKLSKR